MTISNRIRRHVILHFKKIETDSWLRNLVAKDLILLWDIWFYRGMWWLNWLFSELIVFWGMSRYNIKGKEFISTFAVISKWLTNQDPDQNSMPSKEERIFLHPFYTFINIIFKLSIRLFSNMLLYVKMYQNK